MKNADKPINPIVNQHGFVSHQSLLEKDKYQVLQGLTKREYFAAMAMQGLITAEADRIMGEKITSDNAVDIITKRSIQYADALLTALEK